MVLKVKQMLLLFLKLDVDYCKIKTLYKNISSFIFDIFDKFFN